MPVAAGEANAGSVLRALISAVEIATRIPRFMAGPSFTRRLAPRRRPANGLACPSTRASRDHRTKPPGRGSLGAIDWGIAPRRWGPTPRLQTRGLAIPVGSGSHAPEWFSHDLLLRPTPTGENALICCASTSSPRPAPVEAHHRSCLSLEDVMKRFVRIAVPLLLSIGTARAACTDPAAVASTRAAAELQCPCETAGGHKPYVHCV